MSEIEVEIQPGTAVITLNRPDKRNAMTVQMWRDLADACRVLEADRRVRAVLVAGAGKSFCAGADVSALQQGDAEMKAIVAEAETELRRLSVPTVALIHGHCFGGGVQIAVACDLRLASPDATFAVPPAKLGVVYPAESLRTMTALIGPAASKLLVFSGDPIDATTAHRLGLVDELVDAAADDAAESLLARGRDLVASFAPRSLLSQAAAKQIINAVVDGSPHAPGERYDGYLDQWRASVDGVEGPAAFLARRSPEFTWHPADSADA